jgi:hypothetical protein
MMYLLDANVLITAHTLYYPVDGVPEFWSWLAHKGQSGELKIPLENFEEVQDGSTDAERDLLFGWISEDGIKDAILLDEQVDQAIVSMVINNGYANDLTEDEISQLGRDPFLVAYALVSPDERCVVTTEVSKPKRIRQNRHVPDVCNTLGVKCCDTFGMTKALGFKTGWKP